MPILTIEMLRENPQNVILQELPQHPSRVFLRLALMAADYIRRTEGMLMWSAIGMRCAHFARSVLLDEKPQACSEAATRQQF